MFITSIKNEEWYLGEESTVILLSDLQQFFRGYFLSCTCTDFSEGFWSLIKSVFQTASI